MLVRVRAELGAELEAKRKVESRVRNLESQVRVQPLVSHDFAMMSCEIGLW